MEDKWIFPFPSGAEALRAGILTLDPGSIEKIDLTGQVKLNKLKLPLNRSLWSNIVQKQETVDNIKQLCILL